MFVDDFYRNPRWRVPAPLRLRIFEATAIVRASLISSSATTERYSEATGFDVEKDKESVEDWYPVDGGYRAVHSFRFMVTEYLKGSGASEITVRALQMGTHDTEAQALQVATDSLAIRGTSRDAHESILFLWEPTSDGVFYFLISGPYPSLHYTIDTLNRVWLPAKDPPATEDKSSSSLDYSLQFLIGEPLSGPSSRDPESTAMSLGELCSEIMAVDTLIAAGDGTEEYRECLGEMWYEEHYFAAITADGPFVPSETVQRLESGAPEGTAVVSYSDSGPWYNKSFVEGADKDLFKSLLVDDDDRPENGYTIGEATARPLPAGTYQYKNVLQPHRHVPCNYIREFHTIENVEVTAPQEVLHEAFFDPVIIRQTQDRPSLIGADAINGVLKPETFNDIYEIYENTSTTIQRIEWHPPTTGSGMGGTVKMMVIPYTGLEVNAPVIGGTVPIPVKIDFIALNGSVSLSLQVDDATVDATNHTWSWQVSEQPWHDGDKLMVRIAVIDP